MTNITKQDIGNFTVTGKFPVKCGLSPDKDSDESKSFILVFDLVNVPVSALVADALKPKRINWQNGNRNKFDGLEDKSTINLTYSGKAPVDAEAEMTDRLASMSEAEQEAWFAKKREEIRARKS